MSFETLFSLYRFHGADACIKLAFFISFLKKFLLAIIIDFEQKFFGMFSLSQLVEDLESLDLDNPPREFEKRFSDWRDVHNRDYNQMRSRSVN